MTLKRYPLTAEKIEGLRVSSPELYRDMVDKYGIENVINNIIVDVQVLTEDKPITTQGGVIFNPSKEVIKKICKASNSKFEKFIKNPINKLKGWVVDGEELGYSPVMTNHKDTVENRHGFTIGSSYWTEEIKGKLCLFCKFLLISPQSKYNYINGIWREVSPTINDDYTICETSFVNIPAQETNTVLSGHREPLLPLESKNIDGIENILISNDENNNINWAQLIFESKQRAEAERLEITKKQKLNMANYYANCLVSKGIYTSGQKNKLVNKLVSLSSGINVESTVLELLEESKKNSLFMNKPRTVIVKGTLDMSLTKDQRWMAFENAHKHQFMREELLHEFEKAESKLNSVSLSSGEGTIEDPSSTVGELCNKLQKMKEQGLLNDEHKMMLGKTLGDERLASFSDGKGDGKPVESGGTEMPNNTSLSDNVEPTPEADNHLRMLEKGFQAMEDENKKLKEEIEEHKKRHEHLKSILGETK